MASSQKAYFGLGRLFSIILAIIPFTNIVFGCILRIQRNHPVAGILNIFLCPLFYVVDLITVVLSKDITFFA